MSSWLWQVEQKHRTACLAAAKLYAGIVEQHVRAFDSLLCLQRTKVIPADERLFQHDAQYCRITIMLRCAACY